MAGKDSKLSVLQTEHTHEHHHAGAHHVLDWTGVIISGLCAIHCIALPFLFVILPALSSTILGDEFVEMLVLMCSVSIAGISLFWGLRKHRSAAPFKVAALGALLFTTALSLEHGLLHSLLLGGGGICLAFAHYQNLQLCRPCKFCEKP